MAVWPDLVTDRKWCGELAERMASTAMRMLPSVPFLKPTGQERPEASSRCTCDSVVRAPMAPQAIRSAVYCGVMVSRNSVAQGRPMSAIDAAPTFFVPFMSHAVRAPVLPAPPSWRARATRAGTAERAISPISPRVQVAKARTRGSSCCTPRMSGLGKARPARSSSASNARERSSSDKAVDDSPSACRPTPSAATPRSAATRPAASAWPSSRSARSAPPAIRALRGVLHGPRQPLKIRRQLGVGFDLQGAPRPLDPAEAGQRRDHGPGVDRDAAQQREIGFPWSPAMVERSRRSAGTAST